MIMLRRVKFKTIFQLHDSRERSVSSRMVTGVGPAEYMEYAENIDAMAGDIYRYMNFDQIVEFQQKSEEGARIAATEIVELSA